MLPVVFLWTQGKSDKQRTISFPFEDTVKAMPGFLEPDKKPPQVDNKILSQSKLVMPIQICSKYFVLILW